jgi:hypothetical protein
MTGQAELPELNVALIEQILKWAEYTAGTEGHPAWYQGSWATEVLPGAFEHHESSNAPEGFCGTAFCAAGYALHVTGNLEKTDNQFQPFIPKQVITNERGETLSSHLCDCGCGQATPWGWMGAGAHVLGFTEEEAKEFFATSNSLLRLKTLARWFANDRGISTGIGA